MNARAPIQDHDSGRVHQGTARCVIGALPVSYTETDAPPEEAINASITGFVASGLELKYETDVYYKGVVHIPVTEDNGYANKLLTINMIVDSRYENYYAIRRYMRTIQSGQTNGHPIMDPNHRVRAFDGVYRNRLTWIPIIDIICGDDSHQKHQTLRYMRCYPTSLGDLNMNFGTPDPITVVVNFIYSFEKVIRESPPSDAIVPPKGVLE